MKLKKITFALPTDDRVHSYCWSCNQEAVTEIKSGGRTMYRCSACGQTNPRALIIDPKVRWDTYRSGVYRHQTAGVFVKNPDEEFLFFNRTKFPFGLTVPAGHVDKGESVPRAAKRELREETGLDLNVVHAVTTVIEGDGCRRGADVHSWGVHGARAPLGVEVNIGEEGVYPVWLTFEQALKNNPTFAVRFLIELHEAKILRSVR